MKRSGSALHLASNPLIAAGGMNIIIRRACARYVEFTAAEMLSRVLLLCNLISQRRVHFLLARMTGNRTFLPRFDKVSRSFGSGDTPHPLHRASTGDSWSQLLLLSVPANARS